ncbi:exodeoxyribonuclease VII small subunit [Sulfurimonas sp. HSL3-7]|uniref:exodeoxyribonuclease VII small subunit n=1 Tax=Sulfonitrofixus jiaomeiensis TaxID=3131938 RepID=UPI0031F9A8A1
MSEKTAEDFEIRLEKAKAILEKLMNPEITLNESVKAYEEGMKELQQAQKMLENAQLQIEQIRTKQ